MKESLLKMKKLGSRIETLIDHSNLSDEELFPILFGIICDINKLPVETFQAMLVVAAQSYYEMMEGKNVSN